MIDYTIVPSLDENGNEKYTVLHVSDSVFETSDLKEAIAWLEKQILN